MNTDSDSTEARDSEPILSLGGEVDEATVTIRFFGDDLEPGELTRLLECKPSEAYRKGYIVTTTIKPRTVKTGMWFLTIKRNSTQTLEEQICQLLEKLTKDLKVWAELSERFEASIYCGAWLKVWNRDVWLNADLLKQIADRNLSIGLAIYCDCEDDEEE